MKVSQFKSQEEVFGKLTKLLVIQGSASGAVWLSESGESKSSHSADISTLPLKTL